MLTGYRVQVLWQLDLRADDTSKVLLLDDAKDTLLEASWTGFVLSLGSQQRQRYQLSLSLLVSSSQAHPAV